MRAISIQVQPHRSPGIDMQRVTEAFEAVAAMEELVVRHEFSNGEDRGPYFNFTLGTPHAGRLWQLIQERVYGDPVLGPHMRQASMAMCSSEHGWDQYVILFHFDPHVPCQPISPTARQ